MNALYGVYVETQIALSVPIWKEHGAILFDLNSGCLDLFPAPPQADPRLAVVTRNGCAQKFRDEPIRVHVFFP